MLQASSPWPSGTVSGVFFEQRRWEELYEYLGCIENGQSFGALKGDVTSGRLKKTVLWFGSVKPHVKTIKRSNGELLQASSPWPSGTVSGVFFEQRRWEELYEYLGCIENGQSFGALKGDVTSGRLKKTVLWFGSVKPHVKTIKRSNAELLQASSPWPSGTVFWATEMGGALWISWLHWEWPVLWRPEGRCHFRAVKKDRSLIWQRKTPCKNH